MPRGKQTNKQKSLIWFSVMQIKTTVCLSPHKCQNGHHQEVYRHSHCGLAITNSTSIREDSGSNPGPAAQWVKHLALSSLQIVNAGEGVEKTEPSYTVGRNVNWCRHHGKQYGDSLKT